MSAPLSQYLVDDIGIIVERIKVKMSAFDQSFDQSFGSQLPMYQYGHRMEIVRKLNEMEKDKVLKFQKFPLICLRLDTSEDVVGDVTKFNLNLAIVHKSKKEYDSAQRYSEVFKPVLYPMYKLFLQELKDSGLFFWPGDQGRPPHTKIDRLYWGTPDPEGNVKNLFSDTVDAIEIVNLKINQRIKTC